MGPMPWRHWKAECATTTHKNTICFNGANALAALEGPTRKRHNKSESEASMGPMPWRHWKLCSTDSITFEGPCFNGANALAALEGQRIPKIPRQDRRLQWGQCLGGIGSRYHFSMCCLECGASMGPMPWRHWKRPRARRPFRNGVCFNGANALAALEGRIAHAVATLEGNGFNGANALAALEGKTWRITGTKFAGFNGANALAALEVAITSHRFRWHLVLQWGQCLGGIGSGKKLGIAHMTAWLQWGQCLGGIGSLRLNRRFPQLSPRFNGANALAALEGHGGRVLAFSEAVASMGPMPWRHWKCRL